MWAADLVTKCEAKRTVADYSHRKPKMIQRKEGGAGAGGHPIDRHRQQLYHGLRSTHLTRHLGCNPPSHAYSPSLKDAAPPSYHRKSSSITENVLGAVHVKRFDPSLPGEWHNRQATDVTEQLRFIPPTHVLGSAKPGPWYGRARTYVTNPDVDDYSTYRAKYVASKEKERQLRAAQVVAEEVCRSEDVEPAENWDWNGAGHKLHYPEDVDPAISQNWARDEASPGADFPPACSFGDHDQGSKMAKESSPFKETRH